jgi:HAD superfamily hydrolase (TIGR01549 family)
MNILWDFDGTLINSYPAYTDILYEVLDGQVSKHEILAHLKISFTHAVRHFGFTEQQIKRSFASEQELHPEKTPPFPHVENVIKSANINVIMTHKPRNEVISILEHYNWMNYFNEIVAGDDGFPKKPDPASYIYLHNKYKIDLAVGDREIDIIPAKMLDIQTCLFQNSALGADFHLESYEDFSKLSMKIGTDTSMHIEKVSELEEYDLSSLLEDSKSQGYRFVQKLIEEYNSGFNRFEKRGESLFVAIKNGSVIGVGGLNIDPYLGREDIGRVRHLYVMKDHRRGRVGESILEMIVKEARNNFIALTLFTNNSVADRMYMKLGFKKAEGIFKASHVMNYEN